MAIDWQQRTTSTSIDIKSLDSIIRVIDDI